MEHTEKYGIIDNKEKVDYSTCSETILEGQLIPKALFG